MPIPKLEERLTEKLGMLLREGQRKVAQNSYVFQNSRTAKKSANR